MFYRVGPLFVVGLSFTLVAAGCSTVEDTITGDGAETTQTAAAEPTTTAEPEPTTTTAQGYVSEGTGLPADELRQMLDAVGASGGDATDIDEFGFTFPVLVPDGAELDEFEIFVFEGSRLGEAQRSAETKYSYPFEKLKPSDVEEYLKAVGAELGNEGERNDGDEAFFFVSFDAEGVIEGERLSVSGSSTEVRERSTLTLELTAPSGNPRVVGDPALYSSWFDGLVPVPAEGVFTAGGAGWATSVDARTHRDPGETLRAEFAYLQRTELELKDEVRELAEASNFSVSEDNGDLVLENDEVVATYNFDTKDTVRLKAYFKNPL